MDELLPCNNFNRKIIHLDMDAFYASVEIHDDPTIANKAVIIGQDPRQSNGHGVVATANYLARKYGVHSAMTTMQALRLVPAEKLVFIKPNFEKYRRVSDKIHQLMYEITDAIESVALDEAYMDVTTNKMGNFSALELATNLQKNIYRETGLTSSFGVSYNKYLAKMGSEYAKPFGRTVILPDDALEFIASQKIGKFPGIGVKMQEQLHELQIYTGADLQKQNIKFLLDRFNKAGYIIAQQAKGIDLRPVISKRPRKSLGLEHTFDVNIYDYDKLLTWLRNYSCELAQKLRTLNLQTRTVVIKLRTADFITITRRSALAVATTDAMTIYQHAKSSLEDEIDCVSGGVRLLGLSATDFEQKSYETLSLDLF